MEKTLIKYGIPDYTTIFDDSNIVEVGLFESEVDPTFDINPEFVQAYLSLVAAQADIANQLDTFKKQILLLIESGQIPNSLDSNGLSIVYTSATTSTTIDSKKLKSTYPDIAAECSRTNARKAYVTLKESTN